MGRTYTSRSTKKRNKRSINIQARNKKLLGTTTIIESKQSHLLDADETKPDVSNADREKSENDYNFEWGCMKEYNAVKDFPLETEVEIREEMHGYRIVDIAYLLKKSMFLQSAHLRECSGCTIQYVSENRTGLVSTVTYRCNFCDKNFTFETEDPKKPTVNTAAVWGTLATGSTYAHLSEFLGILDVPSISGNLFFETQRELGLVWKESLWSTMEAAGMEEYKLAKEQGDVDSDGIPYVTVFLDGGWSKRSYGHSYNAASGVIQGQLSITRCQKCYFVVYSGDKHDIFIEEIQRDDVLWTNIMLPKLIEFYKMHIARAIILNTA